MEEIIDEIKMDNNLSDTKYQKVKGNLESYIRSGKFRPGTQLPGEREIARQFNVSTVTVHRAISEMVDARWLERRPRIGTFVHSEAWQSLSVKLLNLVVPLYDNPMIRQFIQMGKSTGLARGYTPREIRVDKNHSEVAEVILDGSYSIVLSQGFSPDSPIVQAMKQVAGRAVLLSGRMDNQGVHSVMGDDRHMIRMAMDYFRRLGHQRIGLVCCRSDNYVERERMAAWSACHGSDARNPELQSRLLVLDLPIGEHPMDRAYKTVRDFLQSRDQHRTTALILPDDETAMAALSACRNENVSIPGDLSVISIGNTSYAEHLSPQLTSLDPNMEDEVALALDLLTDKNTSNRETGLLHAVEPKLVVRESTGQVKRRNE